MFQQGIAGKHAARAVRQTLHNHKFTPRQIQGLPVQCRAPTICIHRDPVLWRIRTGHAPSAAPQNRLHTGNQFARRIGFAQIIVRAHAQPQKAVNLLYLGGRHDDWHVTAAPHLLADDKSVDAGQHQVKHQQIIGTGQRGFGRAGPFGKGINLHASGDQVIAHDLGQRDFVFDDQDAGRHKGTFGRTIATHSPPSSDRLAEIVPP